MFDPQKMRISRLTAGLSQKQAGLLSGIAPRTIRYWEAGKQVPRLDLAFRLAFAYGCSIEDWKKVGGRKHIDSEP